MVRAESPFPDPASATGLTRTERFYYDGIRRIQELVTDPLVSQETAGDSPNAALAQAAADSAPSDPNPDGSASTLGLEQTLQSNPGILGGTTTVTYLAREYIWGPGDGPGGVDELLVQYASTSRTKPWWVLQDAGGDVAALCDQPGGTSGTARVAAQYTWDAYGAAVTAEHLLSHPYLHAGHKALFVERLDVGTAPTLAGGETPRLWPHAHAVYQVRNRAYAPALGRFYQRDPNATAMQLIEASSYHGRGLGAIVAAFSMEDMYGDGASLYQYLGSNPWTRKDTLGTSWDPFDMVDDYLAEEAGSRAAFMQDLIDGFNTTGYIALQVAQLYPPIGFAVSVYNLATGSGSVVDALAVGLPVVGKLTGVLGRSFDSYWKGRRAMRAARRASAFGDAVLELHHVVPQFMGGWLRGRVVVLTRTQHQRYHAILSGLLERARMPPMNSGAAAWEQWMSRNAARFDEVRATLVESVEVFKSESGIDMMGDLWIAMTQQGFALRP
jgi:hypothetical protein